MRVEALMPDLNKPDEFQKVAISVLISLIAAGVIGLWSMSQSVARMDERMSNYIEAQREMNTSIIRRMDQTDTRLRALEIGPSK